MDTTSSTPLPFWGGAAGALAPFGLFLAGVAWLGLSGAPDERGFWPILVAALIVSLLLARDRHRWAETVIEGMSRPMVMIMILAWLFAGILGALLAASGLVEALSWIAHALGVSGAGFAVASFLICCVVSTSTGTSLGTVILCAPLLYPTGGALATDPVILMGAILGGATFGDNISPVSDTTIASVLTQGADMKSVVRSRLRYALPAAVVALIVCGIFGAADAPREIPGEAYVSAAGGSAAGVSEGGAQGPSPSPAGLPMLAVPALVIGMLLRRRHLLEGLLTGIAAAAILGLALRLLQPSELLHIDAAQFGARGLVVEGLEKGLGVSVFTLLLMGLVATIEAAGVVARIVEAARRRTHSLPAAEWWTLGTVSATTLLTTHPTVAILMVGDFTRRMGEEFGISPPRRANLLDTMACSWPFIFPWFIPAILASSMTIGAGEFGMPRLTALQVGLANAHSWALLGMMLVAVAFGYGRDRPASLAAAQGTNSDSEGG